MPPRQDDEPGFAVVIPDGGDNDVRTPPSSSGSSRGSRGAHLGFPHQTRCPRQPILGSSPTRFAQIRNEYLPSRTRTSRHWPGDAARTCRVRFRSLVCFRSVFCRLRSKPLKRFNRSFRRCVIAVGLAPRIRCCHTAALLIEYNAWGNRSSGRARG